MEIIKTDIRDLVVIKPKVFEDERGYFFESWQKDRYSDAGVSWPFVQDNVSRSSKNVLRGLHLQNPHAQGKLVYVLEGEVFDVAVDVRRGSPTFGKWHGLVLSDRNRLQFFVPPGFAHGFCVLSETALFTYKCTDIYAPQHELTISWNDPAIGIAWPVTNPILSKKDQVGISIADLPVDKQVAYTHDSR